MPLAVATSLKTAEAEHQLEMAHLRHCFGTVVGRDQVKHNKPNSYMTVMVPDVLTPTAEVKALCIGIARDLHEVKAMFQSGN